MRTNARLDRPRRVVLASHSPHLGGAELSLLELAIGLHSRPEIDVEVLVPGAGPLVSQLRSRAIGVSVVPQVQWAFVDPPHRLREIRLAPKRIRQQRHALRRLEPDVVVTNTLTIAAAALAARSLHVPHIWMIHEEAYREDPLSFLVPRSLLLKLIGQLSRTVVAPSRSLAQSLEPAVRCPVAVAHPSVELTSTLRPLPEGQLPPLRRLVCVGAFRPVKRVEDAISALGLLRGWGLEIELVCIGSEHRPQLDHLRRHARRLGVTDWVEMRPFACNVWEQFGDDTALVICGAHETFGRVTVEAMRRSLAVVAAAAGANAELISHERTGLLFSPRDPHALARAVFRLASDYRLRRKLTETAYSWARSRFSMDAFADTAANLINEVVGK